MQIKVSTISKPNQEEILAFLQEIDNDVIPPLSRRVELKAYSEKICRFADCVLARLGGHIVGLSATYCNDLVTRRAFLTLIAVVKDHRRCGLATKLLNETFRAAKSKGMKRLILETSVHNESAVSFYTKSGFHILNEKRQEVPDAIFMEYDLEKNDTMKLAIMQPYLFPYIGYFQLIGYADKWVVFDNTQYISKGWINRNRMLHPDIKKEWQYFTVPTKKHSRETRIYEVHIHNNVDWRSDILAKLSSYKKKAPFYQDTIHFVKECLENNHETLSEFVTATIKNTCEYLNIPFNFSVFSKIHFDKSKVEHAGQWALEIAHDMNADEYINPTGGFRIFKENEFEEKQIKLRFLKPKLTDYVQRRGGFVPGLSIIDVMMWNDKDTISKMIKDFDILTYSDLTENESEIMD